MTPVKAITFTFPGGSQQYKTTYWGMIWYYYRNGKQGADPCGNTLSGQLLNQSHSRNKQ